MSHDGVTWCGIASVRNLSMTWNVAGSITETVFSSEFGT